MLLESQQALILEKPNEMNDVIRRQLQTRPSETRARPVTFNWRTERKKESYGGNRETKENREFL